MEKPKLEVTSLMAGAWQHFQRAAVRGSAREVRPPAQTFSLGTQVSTMYVNLCIIKHSPREIKKDDVVADCGSGG